MSEYWQPGMKTNPQKISKINLSDTEESVSRNQFENNGHISEEDLDARIHVMLPPLAEGHSYAFEGLSDGRTAVIVEEDNVQRCTCAPDQSCIFCKTPEQSTVRDQFGRKYAGQ